MLTWMVAVGEKSEIPATLPTAKDTWSCSQAYPVRFKYAKGVSYITMYNNYKLHQCGYSLLANNT